MYNYHLEKLSKIFFGSKSEKVIWIGNFDPLKKILVQSYATLVVFEIKFIESFLESFVTKQTKQRDT